MKTFVELASVFILFSFVGWIIECIYRSTRNKHLINPGFMVGLCLPIYGSGVLVLYLLFKIDFKFIDSNVIEVILKVIIGTLLCTLIEFLAGFLSLKYYHNRLWDYSNRKFNIMGIICPQFSLIWTLLIIVYYFVFNSWLGDFTNYIYSHQVTFLLLGVVIGIFLVDLGYSLKVLDKLRKYASKMEEIIDFEAFKKNIREKTYNGISKVKNLSIFKFAHKINTYLDDVNHKHAKKDNKDVSEINEQ